MRSRARRGLSWAALVAASLAVLLIVDGTSGLFYRTNERSGVWVLPARSGKTDLTIVVFPGYIMAGDTLGRAFAPFLRDDDAMVVVEYAERGVNARQISENVMAALRPLRPRQVLVYGASMGGMVGKLFLDRYRLAGAPYGKAFLVLDTAPAAVRNVRRPAALFGFSCSYRGGLLSSVAWAVLSGLQRSPPTEPEASQSIVRAAHRAGSWVGMPTLTSQACFIARFREPKPNELVDIVSQASYLLSKDPSDDPLIRIWDSVGAWRRALPHLRVITLPARPGRYHLPLAEYPRTTVGAILASTVREGPRP